MYATRGLHPETTMRALLTRRRGKPSATDRRVSSTDMHKRHPSFIGLCLYSAAVDSRSGGST